MHLYKNKTFTIKSASFDSPIEFTGLIIDPIELNDKGDQKRLVIYKDNKRILILETNIDKIVKYLQTEFSMTIYSVQHETT